MLGSLRLRVAVGSLLVLILTCTVLGAVLASQARRDASRALDARLIAEARAVAQASRESAAAGQPAPDLGDRIQQSLSPGSAVFVLGPLGAVLAAPAGGDAASQALAPEVVAALAGVVGRDARPDSVTGRSELHVAAPILQDERVVGMARVTASRASLDAAADRVWARIAMAGGGVLAFGALMFWWLSRPVWSGLDALRELARRLAQGQLSERAPPPAYAEGEPVVTAVNEMAASLERQVRETYRERDTFGAVIDTMADALLVIDGDGVITLANPAAGRLFDPQGAGLTGRRLMEAVRDHDLRRIVEKARVEGRFQSAQMEYGRELRPLRISVTPLQERGGRSTLVLCQDLTDVQRLLAMRREFVANVSHELRTPLASVKAAAEALDAGALEDGAAARDFLRRITIEVDHMAELVQRLLELARLETGRAQFEVQPLETGKLIAEAVERVRPRIEAQGLRLMMDVPQGVPWLLGDRAAIHGVLLNLLDNALKFTEQGQIKVSARAAGEMVEVAVEDTGRGIEPQDLPHVFERFYKADRSRSSPGAGLGLALAKHAVQALGGRIWAESERGKGAAFRFALPAAKG